MRPSINASADIALEACVSLSTEQEAEVRALLVSCEAADAASACVQFDHALNFRELRGWILLREGGVLVGLGSLFGPGSAGIELSVCVLPAFRRRGLFSRIASEAVREADRLGMQRLLAVVDRRSTPGRALAAARAWPLSHTEHGMRLPADAPLPAPPDGFGLRPALEDDVPALIAASVSAFDEDEAVAESMLRTRMDSEALGQYAILLDDRIAGLVAIGTEGSDASINGLGVVPAFRGRGLARAAVSALAELLRARGLGVTLDVDSMNPPALALYHSLGFIEERTFDYFVLRG